MKTFRCVGAWVCGCVGEEKNAPARQHPQPPKLPNSQTPARPGGSRHAWHAVLLLAFVFGLATAGCGYYGFTGASIPQEYETIAIVPVEDATANPFGNLDNELTELLTERFVERTRLRLETNENEADVVLAARLNEYRNEPTAVSGDERATLNRVRINAAVRYYENGSSEDLLNDTFSNSEEYDPTQSGVNGERQAANATLENIADDIFSNATSNW